MGRQMFQNGHASQTPLDEATHCDHPCFLIFVAHKEALATRLAWPGGRMRITALHATRRQRPRSCAVSARNSISKVPHLIRSSASVLSCRYFASGGLSVETRGVDGMKNS